MKTTSIIAMLLSSLIFFGSCNNTTNKEKGKDGSKSSSDFKLTPMTNNPDAEKLHMYFSLNEMSESDSSIIYQARSLYNEDTVGFKLEVIKNIAPGLKDDGTANEEAGFKKGAIKISSLGKISDNFIKNLETLFKVSGTGKMTSETILPTVFSSNIKAVDLSKAETYAFKLFFDKSQDSVAEIFAVVDTYKRSFELNEKDATFREAIIATFQGK